MHMHVLMCVHFRKALISVITHVLIFPRTSDLLASVLCIIPFNNMTSLIASEYTGGAAELLIPGYTGGEGLPDSSRA